MGGVVGEGSSGCWPELLRGSVWALMGPSGDPGLGPWPEPPEVADPRFVGVTPFLGLPWLSQ